LSKRGEKTPFAKRTLTEKSWGWSERDKIIFQLAVEKIIKTDPSIINNYRCRLFLPAPMRPIPLGCYKRLKYNDTRLLIWLQLKAGGAVYRTPLAIKVLRLERRPVPAHYGFPMGSYLSQWAWTFY
jgi:hypothetical protein